MRPLWWWSNRSKTFRLVIWTPFIIFVIVHVLISFHRKNVFCANLNGSCNGHHGCVSVRYNSLILSLSFNLFGIFLTGVTQKHWPPFRGPPPRTGSADCLWIGPRIPLRTHSNPQKYGIKMRNKHISYGLFRRLLVSAKFLVLHCGNVITPPSPNPKKPRSCFQRKEMPMARKMFFVRSFELVCICNSAEQIRKPGTSSRIQVRMGWKKWWTGKSTNHEALRRPPGGFHDLPYGVWS